MEISISFEMTAPRLPGKYCAFFRFVHGDNHRFGQKVWCDILVKEEENKMMITPSVVQEMSNVSSENHSKEERSSLLNESEQE